MHARPLVTIHLNRKTATYSPGEAVSGYLHIDAGTDCQADAFSIALQWTADNGTRKHTTQVATKRVDGGVWRKGEHAEVPFAFIVPPGPATFETRHVSVRWQVMATAEVDWNDHATACVDLVLTGAAVTEAEAWNSGDTVLEVPAAPLRPRGGLSTFGLSLLGAALFGVVMALGTPSDLVADALLLVALGLSATGLTALWWAHRNQVAAQKTGEVTVSPHPLVVHPGGTLEADIAFPVLTDLRLNRLDIALRGESVSFDEDGSVGHREPLYETDARPLDKVTILREEEVRERVGLTLPAHCPYSFYSPVGAVQWELEVHIDIPNWPDFVARWPVQVRPGSNTAAAPSDGSANPAEQPADGAAVSVPDSNSAGPEGDDHEVSLQRAMVSIRHAVNPTERELAVRVLQDTVHDIVMVVNELVWTSALDRDDRMQGGRTVVGHLVGDENARVAVRFPPEHNAKVEQTLRNQQLSTRVVMKDWNPLFARPEFDVLSAAAASHDGAGP